MFDEAMATATAVEPTYGNYVGETYTEQDATGPMFDGSEVAAFEAAASAVAAEPGGVLLDYLRVTLRDSPVVRAELQSWLGEYTTRGFGWRGWYDHSATVLEGGVVAWCSQADIAERQGLLVDLPGRAVACLGERLQPFVRWCLANGHVTRADYAIDDRDGRLTCDRILDAEADGGMVSRWQGLTLIQRRLRGKPQGWTVYIGSRRSEAMARIYDKAAERRRKGEIVEGSWVRFELECKGNLADALCREVMAVGNSAVIGQINRRLRFAEVSSTDSNRRRWPTLGWWADFIGSVKPGRCLLSGERPECSVEHLSSWVERQAGPALATLATADGGDLGRLFGILERGQYRMLPKHRAALSRYRLEVECASQQ